MLLADALSICPTQASGEIKLDIRVNYIAFSKTWIAKLKETMREDPILGTVYQLTQQVWPHQEGILHRWPGHTRTSETSSVVDGF